MRDSGDIENELRQVRKERKELEEKKKKINKTGLAIALIAAIIILLFFLLGCTSKQEDYTIKVIKSVEIGNCQVVTFANKFTYYTLYLPPIPKYKEGDIVNTDLK